jgi:hypothetical protein
MSFKIRLAVLTVVTLVATLFLHMFAIKYKLYWTASDFDTFVHFIAGVSVGLFFVLIYPSLTKCYKVKKPFLWVTTFILVVGMAWEVFEVWAGFLSTTDVGYRYDTTIDLIADTLGAWAAYFATKPRFISQCGCVASDGKDCVCKSDCDCVKKHS